MLDDILNWPTDLLVPATAKASPVPFTRGGGRSLGGIGRATKTDRGFWRILLNDVSVRSPAMRRTWQAIRTDLGGQAGLIAVPAWSIGSAPYVSGEFEPVALVPHDDDTPFDDDTFYSQGAIDIEMGAYAPLSATIVTLRLVNASTAAGINFSYEHAFYETGRIIEEIDATTFRVSIFPSIRAPIPNGATLEVDNPTCLCHLADDRGMDLDLNNVGINTATVEFVEATDYWTDLALGLI